MTLPPNSKNVVYLLGAGASHACLQFVASAHGLLMADLGPPMVREIGRLVNDDPKKYRPVRDLVNTIIDDETDFEHVITFLDDSPSSAHRRFAQELRTLFESVLRKKFSDAEQDDGDGRFSLYSALFDMYNLEAFPEEISGLLTLNYDTYLEDAATRIWNKSLDRALAFSPQEASTSAVKLLKLHGSFDWRDRWPVQTAGPGTTLWIPPGIQKRKDRYPFNALWGLAREILDCDVLRIIGCQLSPNDWDLVSLLFTTRHAHAERPPYTVEVIDSPVRTERLKEAYPYLEPKSLFEIDFLDIGTQLLSEFLPEGPPRSYDSLTPQEQAAALRSVSSKSANWFYLWLRHMAEALSREGDCDALSTPAGVFADILEEDHATEN